MPVRKITKFQTSDGTMFDSRENAEQYELEHILAQRLYSEGLCSLESASDIADYLCTNYTITSRSPA